MNRTSSGSATNIRGIIIPSYVLETQRPEGQETAERTLIICSQSELTGRELAARISACSGIFPSPQAYRNNIYRLISADIYMIISGAGTGSTSFACAASMDAPLLDLQNGPIRHTDCCLSLSAKLFDTLIDVFAHSAASEPPAVLSVGSGSGLLEAALLRHAAPSSTAEPHKLIVEGVEVHQPGSREPVNKYLPEQFYHTVRGTWVLSPRLEDTDVCGLMFVFPRQPSLISHYIDAIVAGASHVTRIVWLGPVADWESFCQCFTGVKRRDGTATTTELLAGEAAGLAEYEMMAILYL